MPVFMVERYIAALDTQGVQEQAARDEALSRDSGIRHLRTTYSPVDELCFSYFHATSQEAVAAANEAASMAYERITEVIVAPVAGEAK